MSDTQPEQPEQSEAQILANTCLHCSKTRTEHGESGACLAAGYYGNRFTPSLNATLTVTFGDATPVVIILAGAELAEGAEGYRYLSNASRGFIADEVEKALVALLAQQDA